MTKLLEVLGAFGLSAGQSEPLSHSSLFPFWRGANLTVAGRTLEALEGWWVIRVRDSASTFEFLLIKSRRSIRSTMLSTLVRRSRGAICSRPARTITDVHPVLSMICGLLVRFSACREIFGSPTRDRGELAGVRTLSLARSKTY